MHWCDLSSVKWKCQQWWILLFNNIPIRITVMSCFDRFTYVRINGWWQIWGVFWSLTIHVDFTLQTSVKWLSKTCMLGDICCVSRSTPALCKVPTWLYIHEHVYNHFVFQMIERLKQLNSKTFFHHSINKQSRQSGELCCHKS